MARFSMKVSMGLQYSATTVEMANKRMEHSCDICGHDFYRMNASCSRCVLEDVHRDKVKELMIEQSMSKHMRARV